MATEIVTSIPAELERAVAETGIAADGAASLAAGFAPHWHAFYAARDEANGIAADQPKKARELRLRIKAIRVAAETTRKSLKEDSLRRGKAIDGINAVLLYQLTPVEERLDKIEKAEERREAARREALREVRNAELSAYCDTTHYALADMSEEAYQGLLAGQKAAKAIADEASRKAEDDRIAAIAAAEAARARIEAEREAERVRMLAENARLAAEKAESDRKTAETAAALDAERKAAAAALAAAEAKAAADRKAAEEAASAERARAEAAAKAEAARLKAEADAREDAIRAEARKVAAEAARLAAVEAERVRVENERKAAEAAAAKAAAAAPDREKLAAFAAAVRALPIPVLATDAGKTLQAEIVSQTDKFARWVESRAAGL